MTKQNTHVRIQRTFSSKCLDGKSTVDIETESATFFPKPLKKDSNNFAQTWIKTLENFL